MVYADQEARLAAIYNGLTRAIRSDGRDARRPRGELFLLGKEKPSWLGLGIDGQPFSVFEFTSADGSSAHRMIPRRPTRLSFILQLAVVMSILSALIVALTFELTLYHAARALMRRNWKTELSRLRVLQAKGILMDLTDSLGSSVVRAHGDAAHERGAAHAARSTAEPSFNVFEVPLVFISAIVIAPLRRKYTKSFQAFVRDGE